MMGWLFTLGGAAVGVAQAGLIAHASRSQPGPLSILGRLLLVSAVLFLAARAGHLASGTVGWMAGFAATVMLIHRRFR
jgi:hypothetical protein